jgi:hypothetical protein
MIKIISIIIACMFLDIATYGYVSADRPSLRIPSMATTEKGRNRLIDTISAIEDQSTGITTDEARIERLFRAGAAATIDLINNEDLDDYVEFLRQHSEYDIDSSYLKELEQYIRILDEATLLLSTAPKNSDLRTQDSWKGYIYSFLRGDIFNTKISFLRLITVYLNNELPDASIFKDLKDIDINRLSKLLVRWQFWTREAIDDLTPYIEKAVDKVRNRGHKPVIVEIAAGYGDLSLGLSEKFRDIEVIPTDLFPEHSMSGTRTGNDYNHDIIRTRGRIINPKKGFIKMSTSDIVDGKFKTILGLSPNEEIIVVGSDLDPYGGAEKDILNQSIANEIILVHKMIPMAHDTRANPDPRAVIDQDVWKLKKIKLNKDIWISGNRYQGERCWMSLNILSRKDTFNLGSVLHVIGTKFRQVFQQSL